MSSGHCGVLLAGGRSVRFGGSPKGLAAFGAGRLTDAPLRALSACCDDVLIAANDAEAASWFPGLRVVHDAVPGLGALGALATALRAADGRTVVVCAWDLPFITAEVLREVGAALAAGARCCVPQHADGTLEPLVAAYDASCAADAETLLAGGERAAHALRDRVRGARWMIADQPTSLVDDLTFFNVNTPNDLQRAASWRRLHPLDA